MVDQDPTEIRASCYDTCSNCGETVPDAVQVEGLCQVCATVRMRALVAERDTARAARDRCRRAWKRWAAYGHRRRMAVAAEKREQWQNLKTKQAATIVRIFDEVGVTIAGIEADADAHGLTGQMLAARDCLRAVAALRGKYIPQAAESESKVEGGGTPR